MIFGYLERFVDRLLDPVYDEMLGLKGRLKIVEEELSKLLKNAKEGGDSTSPCVVLPDGSAFGVLSTPLPKDHWLYAEEQEPPPMGLRCGTDNVLHMELCRHVRNAAQYAVRAATIRGTEDDFDPDALVQNMVVGLLGYATPDGLSDESWQNPNPPPSIVTKITRLSSVRAVDNTSDR